MHNIEIVYTYLTKVIQLTVGHEKLDAVPMRQQREFLENQAKKIYG